MTDNNEIKVICHNGKKYGVFGTTYKSYKIPVVIDEIDIPKINQSQNDEFASGGTIVPCNSPMSWRCNISGCISCVQISTKDNTQHKKTFKLHHLIMSHETTDNKIPQNNLSGEIKKSPKIIHLNKLLLDNRRENLLLCSNSTNHMSVRKKKKRVVELPENSHIDPNEIPSYVWYLRADGNHADRFIVKIGDVTWKSTSSKKVSLRYKLEETKYFLNALKNKRPELFENISMNGDFTKKGKELLSSFYEIVSKAGYTLNKIPFISSTPKYLKHRKLSKTEETLFSQNVIEQIVKKRHYRLINRIPIEPINIQNFSHILPKYCYFNKETYKHGCYFVVRGHPAQKKSWTSSTSRKKSLAYKYGQLTNYLNTNNLSV